MSGLTSILKGGVWILRPCEYELLRKSAKNLVNQVRLDALLLTGSATLRLRGYMSIPNGLTESSYTYLLPERVSSRS